MIGPSFDEVHRELVARDPAYEAIYRETLFEDELALGLAELRHERELSQRQLAEKLSVRQPMVARIEKGAQTPTATTLFKLATVLQARIEITPDGATVSQYVPQQHADLSVSSALEHTSVTPLTGIGYTPATAAIGSPWFDFVASWATGNTGQATNQTHLMPAMLDSINAGGLTAAWVYGIGLNQEPAREPAAKRSSISAVTERPAA